MTQTARGFIQESEDVRVARRFLLKLLSKGPLTPGQIVLAFRSHRVLDYSFWTNANLEYTKRSLKEMGVIGYDRETSLWFYVKPEDRKGSQ